MRNKIIRKAIHILEGFLTQPPAPPAKSLNDLKRDLSKIPIGYSESVLIHSGYKALGPIDGGPATVVTALIEEFVDKKNITVAMPAFTIGNDVRAQLKSEIAFDVRNTPTVYRAIPLEFQNNKGVKRSLHPTHSITAKGEKAEWLTNSHHIEGKTFGKQSPFGKLLQDNGWIMGMGSLLGKVTFYHTLEDIEDSFPYSVYTEDSPIEAKCIDADGNLVLVKTNIHDGNVSPVRLDRPNGEWLRNIYTSVLEEKGQLQWFDFAKSKIWICRARDLYETTKLLTSSGISVYTTEKQLAGFILNSINKE